MSRLRGVFSLNLVFGLMIAVLFAAPATAQTYRNDREIRDILRSLNSRIDDFQQDLPGELRRAGSASSNRDRSDLEERLRLFEFKVRDFEVNFEGRRENDRDVTAIFDEAKRADDIIQRMNFSETTYNFWTDIRYQLDRLAANYNVSFDWKSGRSRSADNRRYPTGNNRGGGNSPPVMTRNSGGNDLTGTYRLDLSRSENSRDIAERAVENNNIDSSANRRDLEQKLEAPDQLAISVRGSQVTLASSKGAPVSLTVNGQERTENINGRTVRLRAALRNNEELVISTLGGETDYTITFASIDDGRSLKVTRRVTTEYLSQTVFADSFYTKTEETARLGIDTGDYTADTDENYPSNDTGGGTYSSNDPNDRPNANYPNNSPRANYPRSGQYIVPNGTMITGILDNRIDTKASQNNDRFSMTVQSPNEFRGAVIEGHLTGVDRSGKVSGRSEVTFNFDRIRLRNGESYDFTGFLQSVTDQTGKTVKIGTEGEAKGDSQTRETVKRGGIGAGIGAIIGAIAGGAKGAAIGAIIGGAGGAGSVILTGKEDVELEQGSTITVQSSSPIR